MNRSLVFVFAQKGIKPEAITEIKWSLKVNTIPSHQKWNQIHSENALNLDV